MLAAIVALMVGREVSGEVAMVGSVVGSGKMMALGTIGPKALRMLLQSGVGRLYLPKDDVADGLKAIVRSVESEFRDGRTLELRGCESLGDYLQDASNTFVAP